LESLKEKLKKKYDDRVTNSNFEGNEDLLALVEKATADLVILEVRSSSQISEKIIRNVVQVKLFNLYLFY
jgi:hypothetical protein